MWCRPSSFPDSLSVHVDLTRAAWAAPSPSALMSPVFVPAGLENHVLLTGLRRRERVENLCVQVSVAEHRTQPRELRGAPSGIRNACAVVTYSQGFRHTCPTCAVQRSHALWLTLLTLICNFSHITAAGAPATEPRRGARRPRGFHSRAASLFEGGLLSDDDPPLPPLPPPLAPTRHAATLPRASPHRPPRALILGVPAVQGFLGSRHPSWLCSLPSSVRRLRAACSPVHVSWRTSF